MGFDPKQARDALLAFKDEMLAINYLLERTNIETNPGLSNQKRKKIDPTSNALSPLRG